MDRTDEEVYVGIDVSKATLDLDCYPRSHVAQFSNDAEGHARLVSEVLKFAPKLIVLEATGGLEVAAVAAMAMAQLPVVVVNPRQARDNFASKAIFDFEETPLVDQCVDDQMHIEGLSLIGHDDLLDGFSRFHWAR